MTPDDPRHGTTAGAQQHYKDKSELCKPCRDARNRYNRRSKKSARRGDIKRIDSRLVFKHLQALRDSGMSVPTIAKRSGVCESTLDNILYLRRKQTSVGVAAALFKVQPADAVDKVPAWRIERRLQALHALGWTVAEIARRTGWSPQNTNALMYPRHRRRDWISGATFNDFDTVYRQLCMEIPPPSAGTTVAKKRSAERGWVKPLAWDDIDDLSETPENWAYEHTPAAADRADVLRELIDAGANISAACRRLSISRISLEKWCSRNGLSELFRTLKARESPAFEARNQYTKGAA